MISMGSKNDITSKEKQDIVVVEWAGQKFENGKNVWDQRKHKGWKQWKVVLKEYR